MTRKCLECEKPLTLSGKGKVPNFCGRRCRAIARKRRKGLPVPVVQQRQQTPVDLGLAERYPAVCPDHIDRLMVAADKAGWDRELAERKYLRGETDIETPPKMFEAFEIETRKNRWAM